MTASKVGNLTKTAIIPAKKANDLQLPGRDRGGR